MKKQESPFSYRLKKIASLSEGKILDIGCSVLPNPYLQGEVIGLDMFVPNEYPINYKKIFIGDICERTRFKGKTFDTIILGGIIEHVHNPLAALEECNRILKDTGKLIIETPNPYFLPVILSDIFMSLRYYFVDDHCAFFPRRIMLKNLWRTGFVLNRIMGAGINISVYKTIPSPQWLAQDLIFIAKKGIPNNKYYKKVMLSVGGSEKNLLKISDVLWGLKAPASGDRHHFSITQTVP